MLRILTTLLTLTAAVTGLVLVEWWCKIHGV